MARVADPGDDCALRPGWRSTAQRGGVAQGLCCVEHARRQGPEEEGRWLLARPSESYGCGRCAHAVDAQDAARDRTEGPRHGQGLRKVGSVRPPAPRESVEDRRRPRRSQVRGRPRQGGGRHGDAPEPGQNRATAVHAHAHGIGLHHPRASPAIPTRACPVWDTERARCRISPRQFALSAKANEAVLLHGTTAENLFDILSTGVNERTPAAPEPSW